MENAAVQKKGRTAKSEKERFSYRVKRDFQKNKTLYLLVLLPLLFYILFHYLPMYGAIIAFKDYKPNLGITGSRWVGAKHFINFFSSPSFKAVLTNTIRISGYSILFSFVLSSARCNT